MQSDYTFSNSLSSCSTHFVDKALSESWKIVHEVRLLKYIELLIDHNINAAIAMDQ